MNPTDDKSLAALPAGSEPTVLGFEAAGAIAALGSATEHLVSRSETR